MKPFKELFKRRSDSGPSAARGSMVTLVGGYLVYLGIQMLRDTKSGASSMSMQLTLVLMSIMILAGLAVLIYGICTLISEWKKTEKLFSPVSDDTRDEQKEGDNV